MRVHYVFGKGMTCVVNVQTVWFLHMVCTVCKHVGNPTHVWNIQHVRGKSHMCAENPAHMWKNTHMKECLVYLETSRGRPR